MIDTRYIKEVTIDAFAFQEINKTISEAIKLAGELGHHEEWASKKGALVKFEFNGVLIAVRMDSDPALIRRDFFRAMSGYIDQIVDPYPTSVLSDEEVKNDARIEAANEHNRQVRDSERQAKADEHRKATEAKLSAAPPLEFANKSFWDESVESIENADYSKSVNFGKEYMLAIVDYAEKWGRLMQVRIDNGASLSDIADETSDEANVDGITGNMHGGAVMMLAGSWKYGNELRRWHNKKWGASEDASGVVNPAVLTVSV
jgi:hypothetical protein